MQQVFRLQVLIAIDCNIVMILGIYWAPIVAEWAALSLNQVHFTSGDMYSVVFKYNQENMNSF